MRIAFGQKIPKDYINSIAANRLLSSFRVCGCVGVWVRVCECLCFFRRRLNRMT